MAAAISRAASAMACGTSVLAVLICPLGACKGGSESPGVDAGGPPGAPDAATAPDAPPGTPDAAPPDAEASGVNYAYDDPFTSPRTQWWRDARFGMFIHFGVYSHIAGQYGICRDAEWIERNCLIPQAEYEAIASHFNPDQFDASAIVALAKAAGQRYIVITSKHHDGYAMWPTHVNTWNLHDHSAFDPGRDILAELRAAADAQGVYFGLYYSIWDWHNPNFRTNFPQYKKDMYDQLAELIASYHPRVLWFDGEWTEQNPTNPWSEQDGDELQTYLHSLDPDLIVNNRVDKRRVEDGDYGTPEQEIPAAPVDGQLWESCMTINDHWGFAGYDENWKSPAQLTRNLIDIVSRSGNYLLNIGPDPHGAVPAGAVASLQGMGAWIGANGQAEAIHGAGVARQVVPPAWGAAAEAPGGMLLLSVYSWPAPGGKLHLTTLAPMAIQSARVLGSDQTVTFAPAGDGFDVTPAGAPTNDIATVIELDVTRPAAVVGTGTGLTGTYFANDTFTGTPLVTRVDATLDFSWRFSGSAAPSLPQDHFAIRWTGSIQPEYSESYTFLTVSDDTAAVWIDGQQIIGNLVPHGAAVDKASLQLQAGHRYTIRVETTEQTGEATFKLLWYAPDVPQEIVPARQLYPE